MNLSLENKTALVCGGSRGIGKACAIALADLGAEIIVCSRNEETLRKAVAELPVPHHQHHHFFAADFSDPKQLKNKFSEFLSAYNRPIHILVNNAGGPPSGPLADARPEDFTAAFNMHLICNHLLAVALLPGMRNAGYGRIINIISTSVKTPLENLGVSNSIRAAVANWAKTLANEIGKDGITVNNVLPGATLTERLDSLITLAASKKSIDKEAEAAELIRKIPLGRFGKPEDVANAVAFLASPAAGYITGINIPVDGGRTPNL